MSLRPAWSTYELQTNQGCAARSQKEKNERSHLVMQCCNPSAGEAETAEFPEWWPASLLKLSSEFNERLCLQMERQRIKEEDRTAITGLQMHMPPHLLMCMNMYTHTPQ